MTVYLEAHFIFSGAAAPPVPNFSCLLRTSRGGFAAEWTKAIFATLPAEKWTERLQSANERTAWLRIPSVPPFKKGEPAFRKDGLAEQGF